jgi:hypothetical protein
MAEELAVWVLRELDLEKAIKKAARENNARVFEWLHSQGLLPPRCKWSGMFRYWHHNRVDGQRALGTAAANGSMEVLEWMLARDAARLEDCRYNECEPLRLAAENGRVDVLRWLHARGVEPGDSVESKALIAAAENGHVEVLEWMREQGAAERKDFLKAKVLVAEKGRVEVLKWMQARNLITLDDYDYDMLRGAVREDHIEILELMLSHGASWKSLQRKSSPRALCGSATSAPMLEWLKKHGCVLEPAEWKHLHRRTWISKEVREWLAFQMTCAEFACNLDGREKEWRAPRLKSMAMLILAGRKSKPRLPPELWELVHEVMF